MGWVEQILADFYSDLLELILVYHGVWELLGV